MAHEPWTLVCWAAMASVAHHRHSFRDYLDLEEISVVKHEFMDGEIFAMAGGTPEHSALCAALIVLLGPQLRNRACRAYTSDLRLRVLPTGLATYPDVAVICGEPERDPGSRTHVTNPTVIFEVLSPGTKEYDLGEKREQYQLMESLQVYVAVAQDRAQVEVWQRGAGGWSHDTLGTGQALTLNAIGCELAVDEIYREAGLASLIG